MDIATMGRVEVRISTLMVGGGGALVDSTPFVRRVAGSNPALAAKYGPWASPSLAVTSGTSK